MNHKLIFSLSLFVICLIGCKKADNDGIVSTFDKNLQGKAMLKINTASVFANNPGMRIKINDILVSDVITARTPYPGGGYNTGGNSLGTYLSVPAGDVKVSLMIPYRKGGTIADTLKWAQDSISLFNTNINVTSGKYYTLHITDTVVNNFKSKLFEESLALPTDTLPYFKFVNLMPNVSAVDLYFGPTLVATNIKYLESSPEFTVDLSQTSTAWTVRQTGLPQTAPALATYTSTGTLTRGRKYTAFAMGYVGLAGTAEPRRPFISFYFVR